MISSLYIEFCLQTLLPTRLFPRNRGMFYNTLQFILKEKKKNYFPLDIRMDIDFSEFIIQVLFALYCC